jgi:hypothetical protein
MSGEAIHLYDLFKKLFNRMIDVPQNVAHRFSKLHLQLIQCSRYQCSEHSLQSTYEVQAAHTVRQCVANIT